MTTTAKPKKSKNKPLQSIFLKPDGSIEVPYLEDAPLNFSQRKGKKNCYTFTNLILCVAVKSIHATSYDEAVKKNKYFLHNDLCNSSTYLNDRTYTGITSLKQIEVGHTRTYNMKTGRHLESGNKYDNFEDLRTKITANLTLPDWRKQYVPENIDDIETITFFNKTTTKDRHNGNYYDDQIRKCLLEAMPTFNEEQKRAVEVLLKHSERKKDETV